MQETKKVQKKPWESEQDFPKFLKKVRKEENIRLEQLAEGLMNVSQLARIEKGQRPVHKNMRDRLLGRLGIASDLYENLLDIEDYTAWEQQRDILRAIEQKDISTAQKRIIEYESQMPFRDKIKQQFCLVMRAEVLKQQRADRQEIGRCYEKAVKLTIPNIECFCIENMLLSIQEINIVLEYEFYNIRERFADKCNTLMTFVENTAYDELSKVKIYPKIAYYYLQELFQEQDNLSQDNLCNALQICNRAIEMLRDTGRAFFLLELLEMKDRLLVDIGGALEDQKESAEFATLLKMLYGKYNLSAYMLDNTYLYRQRWVFYIGDVLRIRRKMCGLTQQELCEGICSVKTLRRTEKRQTNMRCDVLGALLKRLGLSKEYQRARVVTNDKEVLKLKEEIAVLRNKHDTVGCRELLKLMRGRLSLEIPENRQYIIELEASLDLMESKITKEEFSRREEEALQCTLNSKGLFCADEIYLTEMEMLCIGKKMQWLEIPEKRRYIHFLLYFFEWYEKNGVLSDCISMYEFVMMYVANELGNLGEHQAAADLGKKVLEESLACKRVWVINNTIYNIMWNEMGQAIKTGQSVDKEKMTQTLEQCILLSHFCRQTSNEKFYYSKLHQS